MTLSFLTYSLVVLPEVTIFDGQNEVGSRITVNEGHTISLSCQVNGVVSTNSTAWLDSNGTRGKQCLFSLYIHSHVLVTYLSVFTMMAFTPINQQIVLSPGITINDFRQLYAVADSSSSAFLRSYLTQNGSIIQPTRSIAGNYTCEGRNINGNRMQTVTVNVNGMYSNNIANLGMPQK